MEYRTDTIHEYAYWHFRDYLDATYGDPNVFSLSPGYPEPGEFPLSRSVLAGLSVTHNGKEKYRPGYGWNAGSREVRQAIADVENALHGTSYSIDNICMVAGATYAFNRIIDQIYTPYRNQDSDFLIIAPTYYRMLNRAKLYANVYSIVGKESNKFQITVDEIENALTPNTKAIFLANPTNPTYIYYSAEFFEQLIPVLQKHKVYLIVDESGDAFNFQTGSYCLKCFGPNIDNEWIIRIVTASKKYLLAEYRIGYVLASKQFMGNKYTGFVQLIGDDIGNAPLATNEALQKIFEYEKDIVCQSINSDDCQLYFNEMSANTKKMMWLCDLTTCCLKQNPKITDIITPDSNFNITFKIVNVPFSSDVDMFNELLSKTKLSLLPCSGLGLHENQMYFRLTYGLNIDRLRIGLGLLDTYLRTL